MNRRAKVIVIAMIVLSSVVAAAVVPAFSRAAQLSQTAATQDPAGSHPTGPEADPYLRHVPGGYDVELELPPDEMP